MNILSANARPPADLTESDNGRFLANGLTEKADNNEDVIEKPRAEGADDPNADPRLKEEPLQQPQPQPQEVPNAPSSLLQDYQLMVKEVLAEKKKPSFSKILRKIYNRKWHKDKTLK